MNINLWKEIVSFTELKKYPQLPCPHCLDIKLTLDETSIQKRTISEEILKKNNRKFREQKNVNVQKNKNQIEQLSQGDGFWLKLLAVAGSTYMDLIDPFNGKQFLFNSFFTCENCNASVTATGIYLQPLKLSEQAPEKSPMIKIDHFSPTIPMIEISKNVPSDIHTELNDAFKHFHFDPLSAASKLRRAIEQFCVDFQLKGKNLHQKICSLKEKYPEEAEYLEALKLIGNEGTHDHDVSEIDLLHAFEIVQFVLEIYDRKARYKETQSNYEQLVSKFDEVKIQLRIPKLVKSQVN
tara:strand:- start:10539 stop:11423 length:885 start_codon:yes stop_codon:yes gene_type:complete